MGERLKRPLAENAVYLNFTKAIGLQTNKGNGHTYFVSKAINESPNIRNFYYEVIKALDFFCLSPQQAAGYYDKKFAAQTAESLKTVAPQAAGN